MINKVVLPTLLMSSALCDASFLPPEYAEQYWQAFLYKAKKDVQRAEALIVQIKAGEALEKPAWAHNTPQRFEDYLDALFITFVHEKPELITFLGVFNALGIRYHDAFLDSTHPADIERRNQDKINVLKKVNDYSVDQLTAPQRRDYAWVQWLLEHKQERQKFLWHKYRINQMTGIVQKILTTFTQLSQIKNQQDADLYLSRLSKAPRVMKDAVTLMDLQKEKGIVPPRFALEKVIAQLEKYTPADITQCPLYTQLADHASMLTRTQTLEELARIVEQELYPSIRNVQDQCRHLLEHSHLNGVWALPNGDDYYQHLLQHHTTTSLTADEIHEVGLKEVKQITEQIAAIVSSLGIETDDVIATMSELMKKGLYESREACMEGIHQTLARSREIMHPLFDLKPNESVEVKPVPKEIEKGMPLAYYMMPDFAGERSGAYFINLSSTDELTKYTLESLTIHEAEPGHHFHISLMTQLSIPLISKTIGSTAFAEGWALYCEKLALEHGFYSSPYHELGHLQFELLRAARLVIDTGIHKKRWTYEQAIEYMLKTTGMPRHAVVTEVERYFVIPGQACAYKVGQIKIIELREKAKKALGDAFDIRMFHNAVLQVGMPPLSILETAIDDYIEQTLSKQ
jgi:uncharacterized protein (DUF885 family)